MRESRKESTRERDRANAREGKGEGGKEGERGRDVRAAGRETMKVAWSKCGSLRAPTNPLEPLYSAMSVAIMSTGVYACACVCVRWVDGFSVYAYSNFRLDSDGEIVALILPWMPWMTIP